jgi:hypothetical protein
MSGFLSPGLTFIARSSKINKNSGSVMPETKDAESSASIATNFLAESFLLPTKILSRSRASNKKHRDAYILVAERSRSGERGGVFVFEQP